MCLKRQCFTSFEWLSPFKPLGVRILYGTPYDGTLGSTWVLHLAAPPDSSSRLTSTITATYDDKASP